jgi:hypothetical protein
MGAKRALLVGINYVGTENALNGCINDVENMCDVLKNEYGYKENDIMIMTDNTIIKPTRSNIIKELLNIIISDATELYFHYSGHGSQIKDISGDEGDKMDECLVPIDYNMNGMILDDELKGLLQCLNSDKKLTIVLDCCHSGSGVDLAYNVYERAGKLSLLNDPNIKTNNTRGKVLCISGCKDNQTSADSFEAGEYQGALTFSFINAIKNIKKPQRTIENLYRSMRATLMQNHYTQIPCITAGNNMTKLNEVLNL